MADADDDGVLSRTHAERRLITCLFADVVGSTDATLRMGPERMKRALDQTFARIRDVAQAHGGTVEKYIGDAVFVIFGVPTSHSDDAARALRAALDILSAFASSADPFSVRLGIETGEALVDLEAASADRQRMAVGACVNIAARLQALAEPGVAMVGPTARLASGPTFAYEPPRHVELKGIGFVDAAQLVGLLAPVESETQFVGRSSELNGLEAAFSMACRGEAVLAVIVAPPGQGKSRLMREFAKRTAPRARLLEARCRPDSETGAFTPLRQLLSLPPGESDPAAVIAAIAEQLGAGGNSARDAAAIAHSAGIANDPRLLAFPRAEREAAFIEAWARLFAAVGPVIAQIEDIHWADQQLLRFVDRMATAAAPLFLLCTARPELAGRTTWRPDARRIWLELGPLSVADARELLASRRTDDHEAIARSGGNPLFLLELSTATAGAPGGLPMSIEAAIGARLDELAPEDRQLLQHAAVAGETFSTVDAALLTDREPADVAAVLGRVSQLRFLEHVDMGYRFYHPLAHEVAYHRLPVAERMHLHARYATTGVESSDIEGAAHHWWEALRPPDADWIWEGEAALPAMREQALRTHIEAGFRYTDRASHERAIAVLERGLAIARTSAQVGAARNALARAYARNGDGDRTWEHRRLAIEALGADGGDAPAAIYADLLELPIFHWGYFKTLPDEATVRDFVARGESIAEKTDDQVTRARLGIQLAMLRPDLAQPDRLAEAVIAGHGPIDNANLLQRLALVQWQRGDVGLAAETYRRVDALVAAGAAIDASERAWWGGVNSYLAGDLEDLASQSKRLTELCSDRSLHMQGHAYGLEALLLGARGQWSQLARLGADVTALLSDHPDVSFCLAPASAAAWGAIARLMLGEQLDPQLRVLIARAIPESPSVQDAAFLLPAALAGHASARSLSHAAFGSVRVWDRDAIDRIGTHLALALALLRESTMLEKAVERLREANASGARLGGALAAAIVEQCASTVPLDVHADLRALGYVGLSQILSRGPAAASI